VFLDSTVMQSAEKAFDVDYRQQCVGGWTNKCQALLPQNSQLAVNGDWLCCLATPFWRDGRPPEDVIASVEETAEFDCNVNGFPRPTVTWMINGGPMSAYSTLMLLCAGHLSKKTLNCFLLGLVALFAKKQIFFIVGKLQQLSMWALSNIK